jgi:NAD(P)-dependent dehydrogenase (short-subunit alcohol dehydrogenase family)
MPLFRRLAVPALVLLLATAAAQAAAERSVDAGILGSVPALVPEGEPTGVVFLFSGQEGWTEDLQRAAERLSGLGAVVLEIDLPAYLDRVRQSADGDCHYLISAIEAASKRLQRELGAPRYLLPILAGTGMGSALAYGALAQAPAATIAGAASDGLVTRLATRLPLCPGAPATATGAAFDYGPAGELPGWWRIAVAPQQRAAAQRFVAGMAQTELVEVPDGAGLDERLTALLAEPLGRDPQDMLDVNLWGTLLPTQVFGEAIAANGKGSIVNISSMNSKRAITRVLGYNMGKAAVDCYTQWFAVELANRYGDKIRVNALAPGFFLTEQNRNLLTKPEGGYTERGGLVIQQTPFKRFGNPDELKGALVWLLSDASQFVTGAMICVDGGFSVFGGV